MMKEISWQEIKETIQKTDWPEVDLIIGIGRSGIIPATLIANYLKKESHFIWLKLRDDNQKIIFPEPRLTKELTLEINGQKVLLIDDVKKTGQTIDKAKELLKGNTIITCALTGRVDINLLGSNECIKLPWSF